VSISTALHMYMVESLLGRVTKNKMSKQTEEDVERQRERDRRNTTKSQNIFFILCPSGSHRGY
jgi:hypothetical protein